MSSSDISSLWYVHKLIECMHEKVTKDTLCSYHELSSSVRIRLIFESRTESVRGIYVIASPCIDWIVLFLCFNWNLKKSCICRRGTRFDGWIASSNTVATLPFRSPYYAVAAFCEGRLKHGTVVKKKNVISHKFLKILDADCMSVIGLIGWWIHTETLRLELQKAWPGS